MPIAGKYFRDGESRARTAIKLVLGALVLGVVLILVGIIWIKKGVDEYAHLSQQRWAALASFNPGIVIPEIVDANKLVVPAASPSPSITESPSPTATASPSPTQTPSPTATTKPSRARSPSAPKRRNRAKPTATPWFHYFKQTR